MFYFCLKDVLRLRQLLIHKGKIGTGKGREEEIGNG